jgi:WXXGXW repeat (2 copies)
MNRKLRNSLLTSSVLATLALGGLGGCIVREEPAPVAVVSAPPPPPPPPAPGGEVIVQDAPPPDVYEVPPPPPGPDFIWVNGYYGWYGGRYVWHRGYYNRPPYGYHTWVRDRWVVGPRGRVFVHGHWG